MTPEEIVDYCDRVANEEYQTGETPSFDSLRRQMLVDFIQQAILEERKACAKIAKQFSGNAGLPHERINHGDIILREILKRGES